VSLSGPFRNTSGLTEGQTDRVTQGVPAVGAVVDGWWQYQRLSVGTRCDRKGLELGEPQDVVAAAEAVDACVLDGGPEALGLVAALLRAADSDDDLGLVGAGPLEDLLHRHGAALIDSIDDLARRDPQFAKALRGVWWSPDDAGADVTQRLSRWIPALKRGT
jgi:hypothetical protein